MSSLFSRLGSFVIVIFIFSSCSLFSQKEKENIPLVTTGATQPAVPVRKINKPQNPSISSGTSISTTQEKMIERIKNITTIDDLAVFSSGMINNPKKYHPKFVELQKKQMLLGIMTSQIRLPEYQKIQSNMAAIYEAKELWTPEILALDAKIQEVLQHPNTNTGAQFGMSDESKKLMIQKSTLLEEIRKSKEFQNYIQKNQSTINNLNEDEKKYWTPEIISLQQEVTDLTKEIYGAPPIK